MTGVLWAVGPCWSCGAYFGFDPDKVPSIVVEGEREQLCRRCVDRANELRRGNGHPMIVPLPGAYAEEGE